MQPGPAEAPDLRLFADYNVAARIQRGEVNAQEALAAGRLKVQGRFAHLLRVDGRAPGLGGRLRSGARRNDLPGAGGVALTIRAAYDAPLTERSSPAGTGAGGHR